VLVVTLPVLYRDAALAVIDKPAGVAVESDARDSVLALLARQLAPPGGRAWPRVVHRLDRDTSGCLAVALNQKVELGFQKLFDEGGVRKVYSALVAGEPPDEGALDTAYGKDPRDGRRYTTRIETPRRARLKYRVQKRLRGAALLEVELDTGRTHQIRVQLSEAGYPLLGDATYGVAAPAGVKLLRTALHAARLSFAHPAPPKGVDTAQVDCTAPLPEDLAAALQALAS
jgi:23S rRNA pseudouridine1911/1915/1917 synthase